MTQHALTFERAFCAASMCSPSRASLFTGLYPAQHGVTQVIQTGVDHADQKTLTIVIRTADHGEMGLAHGGMRQKGYTAYEEVLHVPLVAANPKMFPKPVRTVALASLVDLMPTIATLAKVPDRAKWTFRGRDLAPVIQDAADHPTHPTASAQDSVLFTTDEVIGETIVGQPSHVRCLREADWKVAMWFDPSGRERPDWELYDLANDPTELHNLAAPGAPGHRPAKLAEMKAKLERRMVETGTTPG
jgi:arylsulfatase A-like enzyme